MAYDFTVLSKNGFPEKTISINTQTHFDIFNQVSNQSFLFCFSDYYEDGEVGFQNLPSLLIELNKLKNFLEEDYLQNIVLQITDLVQYAQQVKRAVHGIAD
jgi:hypothetical protein